MEEKEKNTLIEERKKKFQEQIKLGEKPFRNDFRVTAKALELHQRFDAIEKSELEKVPDRFAVAGRIMRINRFGKGLFADVVDTSGKLQVFLQQQVLGDDGFERAKLLDIGDIVGVVGPLTKTRTGELTLVVERCDLLTKNFRPLPEKWHGLKDVEIRYRRRYLDLIANPQTREIFHKRAKAIRLIRNFLEERGFIELETPTMHLIPGGATAKPFVTHHHALDIDLYLRIATELYLKRLVVGGFDRVYELGRVFRNEGVSTWHNPEFTLLEFYQAYATYEDLMNLTEELFEKLALEIAGSKVLEFLGKQVKIEKPFERISMKDALVQKGGFDPSIFNDDKALATAASAYGDVNGMSRGEMIFFLYENAVEPHIVGPTFVTGFPVEVSPLSRRSDSDPSITERFELIICGKEFANAFSELNDPEDQRARMEEQVAAGGEERPKEVDEDFLMALEIGMPPTAGEGIGIDRLMMLLTGSASIREVIPFPLLKPERES